MKPFEDRYAERSGELEAYVERLAKIIDRFTEVLNEHYGPIPQFEIDDAIATVATVRSLVVSNRP